MSRGSFRGDLDATVVVPSIGRASLHALLSSVADARGPLPHAVVVVDDRPRRERPLVAHVPERLRGRLHVLVGDARGPAAARNRGWRAAGTEWVAFLDDDVVVSPGWLADLASDLSVGGEVAGVQGRIEVPLPADRAATDWERDVSGLERAPWATADMAYRRTSLAAVGGFDERFRRAYREDADLGLRVSERVGRIERGRRRTRHPVAPAGPWVSVRRQAGNADDALMRRIHGRRWRERARIPPGRRPRHAAIAAAALVAATALPVRRARPLGIAALAGWLLGTGEFAYARIAPGPRTRSEVSTMLVTSAVIPFAAAWQWLRGWGRRRHLRRAGRDAGPGGPAAIIFDRDGTLIADRPYNADPEKVEPMPHARAAVDRVRAAGVPTAVVSNQSAVGRGVMSLAEVDAVNDRVEELLGPMGPWVVCPHEPGEGCRCRKPAGGMILGAATRLGVDAARCVVIGDIGADAQAAHAAGAMAILVPTLATLPGERDLADATASDLLDAVEVAMRWSP